MVIDDNKDFFSEMMAITKPIHRGKVRNIILGENKSRRAGYGYEIHNIRQWQEGEPMENIDLEASLATWPDEVFILEMLESRQAPLIFVADISPSIFVQIGERSGKIKTMLQSIGAMGLGASRLRDPVGVVCFSDKIHFCLPPKLGSNWMYYLSSVLQKHAKAFDAKEAENKIGDSRSDVNKALDFLIRRFSKRQCSIVIFSDFTDLISGQSELNFKILRDLSAINNFNVVMIFLDEPREFSWRHRLGVVMVKDAETGVLQEIKAKSAVSVRKEFENKRESLRRRLSKIGVDSVVVNYGEHFNQLAKFLSERQAVSV